MPKQFRLESKGAEVFRRGDAIVLGQKEGNMIRASKLLAALPEDIERK